MMATTMLPTWLKRTIVNSGRKALTVRRKNLRPPVPLFELQPLEQRLFLTATIDPMPDQQVSNGDYVQLYAVWWDFEGYIGHTAAVNWGDGTVEPVYDFYEWENQIGSEGEAYAYHFYESPGVYTVTLSIFDGGGVGTDSFIATVQRVPPQLYVSGSSTAVSGSPYTLNLSAYGASASEITSWTIDWGDGGSPQYVAGNPSSIEHTYTAPSAGRQITATATDPYGTYSANSHNVSVAQFNSPSSLKAIVVNDRRIDLAWVDRTDDDTAFLIEYSVNGGVTWQSYTTTYANQTSYSVTGLQAATSYAFRVRARHPSGSYSGYSESVTAATLGVSAPADLRAVGVSPTRVELEWFDRSDSETAYHVEYSGDQGATWMNYTTTYASQTGLAISGLSTGTAYQFRVRARDGNGTYSAYSNVAMASTKVFGAPTGLNAVAEGGTRVSLSWADSVEEESAFYIELSTNGGANWQPYSSTYANQTNYLINSLNPGTVYAFRVRARHSNGTYSAYSQAATVTTPTFTAPSELAATVKSGSELELSWQDNSDDESAFYIELSLNGGTSWSAYTSVYANQTNYSVNSLNPGTTYVFRVRARHGNGTYSAYSDTATATTGAFAAPSGLTVTALTGGTDVDMRWTDNSDNEATFRIEWTRDAGATWSEYTYASANQTSYAMRNLDPGATYGFRVRGRHSNGGYSAYSNAASLTVAPLAAPSSLIAASKTITSIELKWDDEADNEQSYHIEWSTDAGATWSAYTTVSANQTSYTVNSLTPGARYDFRLRARHYNGTYSAFSNQLTITTTALAAPTNLVADVVSGNRVDLSWTDNSDGENAFRIEWSTDAGVTWNEYTTVGGNQTSYTVNGLTPGASYRFVVRAQHSSSAYSTYSNTVIVTPTGLGEPDDLVAFQSSPSQVSLSWRDNSPSETGYEIDARVAGQGSFTTIGTTGANATSFQASSLDPQSEYEFRVRAVDGGSHSPYSNVARVGVPSCPPPTSLAAQVRSGSRIDLTWVDNATSEYSYVLERSIDGGTTWTNHASLGVSRTSGGVTDLTPGATYHFRVRAQHANGTHSAYSNTVSATTEPIHAPSALAATVVSGSRIDLAWTDNSDDEYMFRLERSSDGGETWQAFGSVNAGVTGYSVAGLLPGQTYQFRVRAQHANGMYSSYSSAVSASTWAFAAPSTLSATVISGSRVDLKWADNTDSEYNVRLERSVDGGVVWQEFGSVSADVTSYSVTDLQPGTAYEFRARVQHSGGLMSDYSDSVDVTTAAFQHPTDLAATVLSGSRVHLAWRDNADNEYQYRIERKEYGASTWTEIGSVYANVTSYVAESLQPGTTYQFRVRAYHSNNSYSPYSEVVTVETVPFAAPSALTLGDVVRDSVELRWVDNADNEYQYRVERSMDGGNAWQEVASVYADVTSVVIGGLLPNASYQFRVRAQHASGAYSNYAPVATLTTGFPKPTAVVATVITSSRIDLSWADNSDNEYMFRIERSANGGDTWQEIGSVYGDVTGFSATDLVPGTTYQFRVRAQHANGAYSDYSQASATTVPFDRPSDLEAQRVTASRAQLTWQDNTDDEYMFRIERSADDGGSWQEVGSVYASQTSFVADGLQAGTDYLFRVRAQRSDGSYSEYAYEGQSITALAASTNLTVTPSLAGNHLAWTDNSSIETGYQIERRDSANGPWTRIGIVGANVTTFDDPNPPRHDIDYRVRSYRGTYRFGGHSQFTLRAITIAGAATVDEGSTYTLSFEVPDGVVLTTWSVNWGDGHVENVSGSRASATHVYADGAADYHVSATAVTDVGQVMVADGAFNVHVQNVAPKVKPSSAQAMETGALVTLTLATFTDPAFINALAGGTPGEGYAATVDWGDGSSPEAATVSIIDGAPGRPTTGRVTGSHRYTVAGTHKVTVTVSDGDSAPVSVHFYASVGSARVYTVPGEPGTKTRVAFRLTKEKIEASYKNELALFIVDGEDGRLGNLLPGDAGYALAAMTHPTRQTVFTRDASMGDYIEVELDAGTFVSYYLVQNSTTEVALANNPDNLISRNPNVFFPHAAANPDGQYPHFRSVDLEDGAVRYNIEDLDYGGDKDFDDMVFVINATIAPMLSATPDLNAVKVDLAWNADSTNVEGFRILRSEGGELVELAVVGADQRTFADLSVRIGAQYQYRVVAIGTVGPSPSSNIASADMRTPGSPEIIGAPATAPEGTVLHLTAELPPEVVNPYYNWSVIRDEDVLLTGTGPTFDYRLPDDGEYLVSLTVTANGGSDTVSKIVTATNAPPTVTITNQPTAPIPPNRPVRLGLTVGDPSALDTHTFAWVVMLGEETIASGTTRSIDFTPLVGGDYRVVATVTDDDLGSTIAEANVDVLGAPRVSILGAPSNSTEGTLILLHSDVVGPGIGYGVRYAWSVRKNGVPQPQLTSTSPTFSFRPDDNGQYQVQLIATDAGGTGSDSATISVSNVAPTVAIHGGSQQAGEGRIVNLYAVVSDPGPLDTFSYQWEVRKNGAIFREGKAQQFSFTPEDGQPYEVSLTVTDKDLGVGTATATFNVVPNAPSVPIAQAVSTMEVNVRWVDNSSIETDFLVEAQQDNGSYVVLGSVPVDRTDFLATGLTPGARYRFRISARNNGVTLASVTTIGGTVPLAPANLQVTSVTNTTAVVSWSDANPNEQGFQIELREVGEVRFRNVAQVGHGVSSVSIASLKPNTTYQFRVRAVGVNWWESVYSPYSLAATATTTNVLPINPSNLAGTVGANPGELVLTWSHDPSLSRGLKLERSSDGATYELVATPVPTDTTFTDTKLRPSTTYYYRISAFNEAGYSAFAMAAPLSTAAFAAPTGVTVETPTETAVSNTQLNVSWDYPNAVPGVRFVLEGRPSDSATYLPITDTVETSVAVSSFVVDYKAVALRPGVTYTFRVRAVYGYSIDTRSADSAEVSGTTTSIVPTAPVDPSLNVDGVPGQVTLSWTDLSNNEDNYLVEVSKGNGSFVSLASSALIARNATSHVFRGLEPSTLYRFRVSAVNGAGAYQPLDGGSCTTAAFARPTDLLGTTPSDPAKSNETIQLTWSDNTDNESGFIIEVKESTEQTYRRLAHVQKNQTQYLWTAAKPGTTYNFRVRAFFGGQFTYTTGFPRQTIYLGQPGPDYVESLNSEPTTESTTALFPDAPADLVAQAQRTTYGSGLVWLSWTRHAVNAKRHEVQFSLDGVNWQSAFAGNIGVVTGSVSGLLPDTTYQFRVRAVNEVGASAWATPASARTLAIEETESTSLVVPAAPEQLVATTLNPNQISLTWSDRSTNETNFRVQISTDGETFTDLTLLGVGATSYSVGGLSPSTTYFFRVFAVNRAGDSVTASNVAQATTSPYVAPSNLIATAVSNTQVALRWTDNTNDESGFQVEHSTDGINFKLIGAGTYGVVHTPENMRSYLALGLQPGAPAHFRVRSVDGTNFSSYSEIASVTPPAVPIPNQPTNLQIEVLSASEVRVRWTDNADNETGHEILRWSGGLDIPDIIVGADVNDYVVRGLTPGTPYEFRVRAGNLGGNSYVSELVTILTKPDVPRDLTATGLGQGDTTITWSPAVGATSYTLQRKLGASEWEAIGGTLTANFHVDEDANAPYVYRVLASNASGSSAYSEPAQTQLAPSTGSLTAVALSTTAVQLTWDEVSGADEYRVERSWDGKTNWVTIADHLTSLTFDDASLSEGRTATYRVSGANATTRSGFSTAQATAKLLPPSGVQVTSVSGSLIRISWTSNTSANASALVELLTTDGNGGEQWIAVGTAAPGTTTLDVNRAFAPSTTYQFRVRSYVPSAASVTVQQSVTTGAYPGHLAGLTQSVGSPSSVTLNWAIGSATGRDGFRVERQDGAAWTVVGSVAAAVNSFTDTAVNEGRVYSYRVIPFNAVGDGATATIAATTQLAAPADLKAVAISGGRVDLSWTDRSSNETGYEITYRREGGEWLVGGTASPGAGGSGSFRVTGPYDPLTTYTFRVRAIATGTSVRPASEYSDAVAVTMSNFPVVPGVPTLVGVVGTRLDLSWSAVAGANGYIVERSSDERNWAVIETTIGSDTDAIDRTFREGGIYYYRIAAFNASGQSAYSPTLQAVVPLATPIGLTAEYVSGHEVNLSWTDVSIVEAAYRVEIRKEGAAWQVIGTLPKDSNRFTFNGPLDPSVQYEFRVFATNPNASSAPAVTSIDVPAIPTTPTQLVATATGQYRIDLTWNASSNVQTYHVYRRTFDAPWTVVESLAAGTDPTMSFVDRDGVEPGVNFQYRIVAINSNGESGYSNEQILNTPWTDPFSPTELVATAVSASAIDLSWTDESNDETAFVVERSKHVPGWNPTSFEVVAMLPAGTTAWQDTNDGDGLDAATTYYYRVRAQRPDGPSEYTSAVYAITKLDPNATPPMFTGPVGYPGGRPDDAPAATNKRYYKLTSSGRSSYGFTGDPLAGTLTFTDDWVLADSPLDALTKAIVPDRTHITRTRPGESARPLTVPWMDPRFFRLEGLNFVGGSQVIRQPAFGGAGLLSSMSSDLDLASLGLSGTSAMSAMSAEDCPEPDPLDRVESQAYYTVAGTYYSYVSYRSWYEPGKEVHPCIGIEWTVRETRPDVDGDGNPDESAAMDMDVDSFNDGGGHTIREDKHEMDAPGQYVPVNDQDADQDGIPGYADGFGRFTEEGDDGRLNDKGQFEGDEFDDAEPTAPQLIPVYLTIPGNIKRPEVPEPGHPREADHVRVRFDYAASNPMDVTRTGTGTAEDPYIYSLPVSGDIRLWKSTGEYRERSEGEPGYIEPGETGYPARDPSTGIRRDPRSINNGGDFIASGESFEAFEIFGYGRTAVVYVEAVKASGTAAPISVTVAGLSDTVKVSALAVDVDVDSDNTSTGQPERSAAEEQAENRPGDHGRILVVNDADRDNDGIPDFGDLNTGGKGSFVPVVIELPQPIDRSHAAIRITYSASDPADGTLAGSGATQSYKPGEGLLRLWTKDQNQTRSSAAVTAGGDFVASVDADGQSVIYQGDDLEALDFVDGKVTLWVEAVRPGAATITVEVDPDGVDTDLTDPPCVGDENPAPWLVSDVVKLTAYADYAPEAYAGDVRAGDNALLWSSTDLRSNGGLPWGHTRVVTTAPELLLAYAGGAGVAQWPRLINGGSTVFAVIGTSALFFDRTGTAYTPRFGGHETLKSQGGQYLFVDSSGNRYLFEGFDESLNVRRRGTLVQFTNAGGIATSISRNADHQVETVEFGQTKFTYQYFTGEDDPKRGLVSNVKFEINDNGIGVVRKAAYEYYDEAAGEVTGAEFKGNENDLKTVTITDKDNTVVELKHYRYEKKSDKSAPSVLRYIVEGRAAALLANDGATDPGEATNAKIAQFASEVLSVPGAAVGMIQRRGTGASDAQNLGAVGTASFGSPTANPASGTGFNVWSRRSTTQLPGGAQEIRYTNAYGQEVAKTIVADGKQYHYATRYDAQGRVVLSATPSAISGMDESQPGVAQLKASEGVVRHLKYYASGPSLGLLEEESISQGENGSKIKQRSVTYRQSPWTEATVHVVASETVYSATTGTNGATTSFEYLSWFDAQPREVEITLPVVSSAQNGAGSVVTTTTTSDKFGRIRMVRDEDNYTHTFDYNDDTGALILQVTDTGGEHLSQAVLSFDGLGRPLHTQDANGNDAEIVYVDGYLSRSVTTRSLEPSGPPKTVVTEDMKLGKITTERTALAGGTILTKVQVDILDYGGRVVSSKRFPDTTTTYTIQYRYDNGGRVDRVENAVTTVHETTYDMLGRPIADKIGGTTVRTYQYDNGGAGDGNLTMVTDIPGGSEAHRITKNYFDWRNRQVATDNGPTITYREIGNLGQVTAETIYDGTLTDVITAGTEVMEPNAQARRARTVYSYDSLGQNYRVTQVAVNQSNGNLGDSLVTNSFRDRRGNMTKTIAPGGLVSQAEYDGAGRITTQSTGDGTSIVEQVDHVYDDNGNEIITSTHQRLPGSSAFRTSHVASWFDAADRVTGVANYGETGSNALARPPQRPANSSEDLLLTKYEYNPAGWMESIVDPAGIVTEITTDALGRQTFVLENATAAAGHEKRGTTRHYDGLDRVTTLSVGNVRPPGAPPADPAEPSRQDTQYVYGTASGALSSTISSKDLLGAIIYPGGATEQFAYNGLGEVIKKVERDFTVHTYEHDAAGRLRSDLATNLPAVTDNKVRKLKWDYDALGQLTAATSEGDAGGTWGVINQVKREYNEFGQLKTEWQDHNSAVDGNALSIQYGYTYSQSDNSSRLTSVTYPSGRVIGYGYSGIDVKLGRASWVAEGGPSGAHLEEYGYLGAGVTLQRGRSGGWGQSVELDRYGRTYEVEWTASGGATIDHYRYWYDDSGNLISKFNLQKSELNEVYGYNGLGHQTSRTENGDLQQWNSDTQGNRYGEPYEANAYVNNRITSDTYSGVGQTTEFGIGGTAVTGKYDAWGRLVRFSYVEGGAEGQSAIYTFAYDALGRRVLTTTAGPANTTTEGHAYYDGANLVENRDLAGVLKAQYVWSPDGMLILRDANADNTSFTGDFGGSGSGLEQRRFALADGLGNTTAIANEAGVVEQRYSYDHDGRTTVRQGDGPNAWAPLSVDAQRFEHLYRQQRVQYVRQDPYDANDHTYLTLYDAGGGQWYDPQAGRMLSPIAAAELDGRNAYDPLAGLGSLDRLLSNAGTFVHSGLDIIGTIDPIGIADLTNAGLYSLTGDWRNASISVAGAVLPYAGDVLKATRWGNLVVNRARGLGNRISAVSGIERPLVSRGLSTVVHGTSGATAGASMGVIVGGIDGYFSGQGVLSGAWSGGWWGAMQGGIGGGVRGFVNPYICFVAGTQVVVDVEEGTVSDAGLMAAAEGGSTATVKRLRYKTIAIEDLVARGGGEMGNGGGQFVVTRNQHDPDGPLLRARVSGTYQRTAYALQILTVRDADGVEQTLRVTEEHPFCVQFAGWTSAKSLRAGDTILGADEVLAVVSNSREAHPRGVAVYNLEVDQDHTYFVIAEGANNIVAVWVHNATYDIGDELVEAYANRVNSNAPWAWSQISPTHFPSGMRAEVKRLAAARGLIQSVNVDRATRFADFTAVAVHDVRLPRGLWKRSDREQFDYLNDLLGGRIPGYTWHHHQSPGRMQLVPFGIHNVTDHVGGRTIWGGGNELR